MPLVNFRWRSVDYRDFAAVVILVQPSHHCHQTHRHRRSRRPRHVPLEFRRDFVILWLQMWDCVSYRERKIGLVIEWLKLRSLPFAADLIDRSRPERFPR